MTNSGKNPEKRAFYEPIIAVLVIIGLFFGAQILGTLVFTFGAMVFWPALRDKSAVELQELVSRNPWYYLLLVAIIQGIAIYGLRWFMRQRSISWHSLGLGSFKAGYMWYAVIGYGMAFLCNAVVLVVLSGLFPNINMNQEQNVGVDMNATGIYIFPLFIALVVLPPLVEELLMRGFLFTNLRSRLSFVWSAVWVSALFGLAHISQVDEGLFWTGALNFFVLSMVLCYLREKTGSLWPSIGVHMLQNGVALLVLVVKFA